MKNRIFPCAFLIRSIAVIQLLFFLGYIVYLLYIGLMWGIDERLRLTIMSDSMYILLLVSSFGLFQLRQWGWWITIILYINFFLARVITLSVTFVNIRNGLLAENLHAGLFTWDALIILIYLLVLGVLLYNKTRNLFEIEIAGLKLLFFVLVGAAITYLLYFIVTLLLIQWLV